MPNIPREGPDVAPPAGVEPLGEAASLEEQVSLLTEEVDGLRRALETRPLIDLAKGMVMHRYSCGDDAAFGLLRRFSQDHNIKIRDLAAAIVARVDGGREDEVRAEVVPVASVLFEAEPVENGSILGGAPRRGSVGTADG